MQLERNYCPIRAKPLATANSAELGVAYLPLFSFLILLPNNTNYWMKHPFYYAACIHASEIPSTATECRDRISYQASRGLAQIRRFHKWKWKEREPKSSAIKWNGEVIFNDNLIFFFWFYSFNFSQLHKTSVLFAVSRFNLVNHVSLSKTCSATCFPTFSTLYLWWNQ